MNATQKVESVKTLLDGTRIAADKRKALDYQLNHLRSSLPVSVDTVPNPDVDPESYGGKNYWQNRNREDARNLNTVYTKVRAVDIDCELEDGHDTPSGWYPRVELTLTDGRSNPLVVGDLSAEAAVELATALLAAARLMR